MLFCKANVLSEWYFWVQSAKMVSVDIAFCYEATANTGNSFDCDILLIFQGWVWLIQKSQNPTNFAEKED